MEAALNLDAPPPKSEWDQIIENSMQAWFERFPDNAQLNTLRMAQRGDEVYDRLYRATCEREHHGRFVVIDPISERAFVADEPVEATMMGAKACPGAYLHIVRAGFDAVYEMRTPRYRVG